MDDKPESDLIEQNFAPKNWNRTFAAASDTYGKHISW